MAHRDVDLPPERTAALDALSLMSRKWQPAVLVVLDHRGSMGFNELLEAIPDVSGKVLADTLEALEETDLLDRTVVSESPLRVEYELSEAGEDLERVFDALAEWGDRHLAAVTPTVLVAEGDRRLTELYGRWLGDHYELVRAHSGEEVEANLHGGADVLLFAEGVPGVDPERVAARAWPNCRTILLLDRRPSADLLALECDAFLRKPVVRSTLLDAVEAQLSRRGVSAERRERDALAAKRSLLESVSATEALEDDEDYAELTERLRELEERLEE